MIAFRTTILILGLAGLAAACATPEPGSPAAAALAAQKQQEARAEQVKDSLSEVPSWFASPPKDDLSLYGSGSAASSDLQMAVDRATLAAKRTVADRIKSRLSAKMKDYAAESGADGDAGVVTEVERVTSNVVAEADMAGYQVAKTEVKPEGGQYRAYVLLQYPLGTANRLLLDQTRKNEALETRLRASKAFLDLEKEIDAARQSKKN